MVISAPKTGSTLPQRWSTKFLGGGDYFLGAIRLIRAWVLADKSLVNGRWYLLLCQAYVDSAIIHI